MRRSIKVVPHTSWCATIGQFLTLDFGSFFLLAVYRRPDNVEVEAILAQRAVWGRPRQPWLMVGDFNWSPDSNPWLPLLSNRDATAVGVRDAEGNFAPTRWEGHECYAWTMLSQAFLTTVPYTWNMSSGVIISRSFLL